MTIKIDKEFQSLLQPLSKEEYEQLKQNLIADGCREPLVVWGNIIVDGHNRFEICSNYGVAFKTVQKDFKDRQDAMDWIDKNQLGRRNITPDQMSLIRSRMYGRRKKHTGNPIFGGKIQCGQNDAIAEGRTRDALAKELGVGARTIDRDVAFARAVDALPDVKEKIQRGEKVVKQDVIAAAKAKEEGDDEMAEKILKEGTKLPFIPAIAPDDSAEKIKFIFEQAKLFDKWDRAILDIQKEIMNHAGTNPAMVYIYKPFIKQNVQALRDTLKNARPHTVCDACNGSGGLCKKCKGTGFLAEKG